MSVSMDHCGCSSALRFIECKVYSGQKFFDLHDQLAACAGSRVAERHVCGDWHSIHQPNLILTKGLVLVGGPPQGLRVFSRWLLTLARRVTYSAHPPEVLQKTCIFP